MSSYDLMNELLSSLPLSEHTLKKAITRTPTMDEADLYQVLLKNGPSKASYPEGTGNTLSDLILKSAIFEPDFGSKKLSWILEQNSPLAPDVLNAAVLRVPPMSVSDLNTVLNAQ